jgi:putative acetyltransferase
LTALPDFALRPYRESDLEAARALHALAFESLAAERHTREQLIAHGAMTRGAAYAADLADSHLMLAVQADGSIVATAGWIAVAGETATARIRKVFVHPAVARRGIASQLVRDAEARAVAAGHRRLIVRANINAVPLYKKLGYCTLREGGMDAGSGIVLPVHFMEKA